MGGAIYDTDDERTMSFEQTARSTCYALVDAYARTGYSLVVVPTGSVEDRAAFVREFIDARSTLEVADHDVPRMARRGIGVLRGTEVDNSKTYWHANKDVYETAVRAPMEALVDELTPEFGEGKIFRPYRDIRFSADKSPYKTNIAATLGAGYVQLSADGLGAGSGMWHMAPDQLDRYREAVDEERPGAALEGIVATARKAGLTVNGHEQLKDAPRATRRITPVSTSSVTRASYDVEGVGAGGLARDGEGQGPGRGVPSPLAATQRVAPDQRRCIERCPDRRR